jgi:hypothetical protein
MTPPRTPKKNGSSHHKALTCRGWGCRLADAVGGAVGVPQVIQNLTSAPNSFPHCLQKRKVQRFS